MAGDSLNLVNLVRGHLTGDSITRISLLLGESRDRTQSGINSAIPGILSGLDSTASTPNGARRLASAVDDADDGILSNISGFFGKGFSADAGAGMLRSILGGGGLSGLADNVGRSSGLSGKSTTALLGFLAPIVLGSLRSLMRSRGLDASGLSSLLSGQRNNISAAMPEEMMGTRETAYDREPLREMQIPRETRTRATETYTHSRVEGARTSSMGWLLPLALVAGLLGLIWYWGSRPNVQAGREERHIAEETARLENKTRATASLDSLKTKYHAAIQEAEAQGVRISTLSQHDGKLVIKGTAPSTEAANKVWDEIKRINPRMNDITADIRVDPSMAAARAAEPVTPNAEGTTPDIVATAPDAQKIPME